MASALEKLLLEYISKQYNIEIEEIDTTSSLVDQGVIDSFSFVEIAAFLEKTASVRIDDNMITPENFGSIKRIVAFTESLGAGDYTAN